VNPALPGPHLCLTRQIFHEEFVMKTKKSRIEVAREIIANLRRGMNRPQVSQSISNSLTEATPFVPAPFTRSMPSFRPKRSGQLQTSHS
jgi:hypothetical protein